VVEHFWCAPYARALRPHCDLLVLDLHNVESVLARSHARATRGFESMAFARFAEAYCRLEREWLPKFDVVLVASEQDRARVDHPRVYVIPNALPETPRPDAAEANCIVFSGNLEYHPNVEAVRWFRQRIWPLIGGVEWRLIGRNAHAVERIVAGDERIRLTGAVDDAIASIAEAAVCVVPLLYGSGTRFKILEAWAAARAVVSTTIGAEGLGARSGEHLLIADDPDEFGKAVVRLLNDRERRRELGEAGRKFFVENYTWPVVWRRLDEAFG
jgi:glycosyltransferase involved in cell wall biosynthesis